MKLKARILSSVVVTALIFSVISFGSSVFAATSITANSSKNTFIEADFDSINDVSLTRYFDTTYSITDAESTVGEGKLAVKFGGVKYTGVLIGDADTTAKFADNGYDNSRVLVYKTKFYISQALFDNLPETTASYQNKQLVLEPALITATNTWDNLMGVVQCRSGFIRYNGKLYYADASRITTNPIEVSVGAWHEMTWRIEPTDTQTQHVEIYIDETKFTGLNGVTATISNGTAITDSYEKAFMVKTHANNTATETIYLDDINVYQTIPADKAYANHMIYTDFNEEAGIVNLGTSKAEASVVTDEVTKKLGTENTAYKLFTNGAEAFSLGIANKNATTWSAAGYDASKPLVFKTKFYVSSALLAELSTTKYIRLSPMLYNKDTTFPNTDVINDRYALAKQNDKLIYGDSGYFAGRYVELTVGEWHEIVFVLDPENQKGGAQKIYIDGVDKTSPLNLSAFTGTQFMQSVFDSAASADAFGISSMPSTFMPTNALYLDDIEVYQAKNAFTATNAYSGQYSSVVTFSSPVNNSLEAKDVVTLVNADGTAVNFDYTVTLNAARTTATVDFNDAAEGTSYKIKVADTATDTYYQTISGTKEFDIITPVFVPENADALNYMIYANYNKSVETSKLNGSVATVSQAFDDVTKKLGEGNRAYKIETYNSNYWTLGMGNNDNTKTWSTAGYDANKPIIFKTKFYVSKALLGELESGKYIRLVPMLYDEDGSFSINDTINLRYTLSKATDGKLVYGDYYNLSGRSVELAEDEWHEIVFVLDPESQVGADQKVFVDGTDVSNSLYFPTLGDGVFMQKAFANTAKTGAFGISTPSTFVPENDFYLDDVQVYQANTAFVAQITECADDYATVTFTNPVKKDETKIVVSDSKGNILSGTSVSFAADGKSATIGYSLSNNETYTITVRAGLTDEYYQYLTQDVTHEFSSVKSSVLYIDSWTDIAPSSTGASTNVTLKAGPQRADSVLIMAVYDERGKLIDHDQEKITTSYDLTNPVTLSVSKDCSKAEYIKLMLWDSFEKMIPLHKFELITIE